MIAISGDFRNSISSTEREIKGYVEVTFTSSTAKENAKVIDYPSTLRIGNELTNADEIIDDDRKGKNYASLEQDYFKLDGTFVLPNNKVNKNPGMGYISANTFEDDTEIKITPFKISTSFGENEKVNGLTMYFMNNSPLELDIEITSGTTIEKYTEADCIINSNGVVQLLFDNKSIDIVNIYVKDVLYPNRRIRLQEVDFGLSAIYENEELISFKTLEQVNRYGDEIIVKECDVVVGDINNSFDNFNPKGITKYLTKNVKIIPYVGVLTNENGVEYCVQGEYYLDEWKAENMTATLSCKGFLNKLNETFYLTTISLNDIAWYENEYTDNKLEIWSTGSKYREQPDSSYGKLSTGLGNLTKYTSYHLAMIREMKDQSAYRSFDKEYTHVLISLDDRGFDYVGKISLDTMTDYQKITANTPIKDLTISEYQYKSSDSTEKVLYETTINCNGEEVLVYDYGKPISTQTFVEVSDYSKLQIIDARNHIYNKNGDLIYTPTYGGVLLTYSYVKIKYNGQVKFKIVQNEEVTEQKTENYYFVNNDGISITMDNEYIGGSNIRECSNDYIKRRLEMWRPYSTSFEFNGNPAIEVGDYVDVESKYSNDEIKYDRVVITKLEGEFKGSYTQRIEGDIIEK